MYFSLKTYLKIVLGQELIRKTKSDQKLVDELLNLGKDLAKTEGFNYDVISSKTLCAHDFYVTIECFGLSSATLNFILK